MMTARPSNGLAFRSPRPCSGSKSPHPATPPIIIFAISISIVVAGSIGMVVFGAGVSELYDKCGQLCWQGLLEAQRVRY